MMRPESDTEADENLSTRAGRDKVVLPGNIAH